MDFFNSRTFEMFRYIIPSVIMVGFSLWLFKYSKNFSGLKSDYSEISFMIGFFAILLLYVIGIFIDEFVYRVYRIIKKIREKKTYSYVSNKPMSLSEKYSILRMKSKENFTYVEYWNALKGMCRNLSFVGIYIFCCLLYDAIANQFTLGLILFLFIITIFNYLMILRADIYSDFAISEMDSSIDVLKD